MNRLERNDWFLVLLAVIPFLAILFALIIEPLLSR